MKNAVSRFRHTAAPTLLALAAWAPGSPPGLGPAALLAQGAAQGTGRITGTVTSQNGQPLAGVQVSIPATRRGAVTGADGRFTIGGVAPGTVTLRVQRIGYTPVVREVTVADGQAATVAVQLTATPTSLSQVVVTALGIERTAASVPYAVAEVGGAAIAQAAPPSTAAAIYGKAPGVKVQQNVAGPTANSNITIRGVKSITGSSRPLIVVDGIPVQDRESGYSDVTWDLSTRDVGGVLNAINPNDVESMSVLKGAAAAALYGADAANGVILVTTRRGRRGGGVEASTSVTFDRAAFLPDFQNVYGAGLSWVTLNGRPNNGEFVLDSTGTPMAANSSRSFGPRMQGQMVRWWDGSMQPFSPQPDNLKALFDPGHNALTTVALSNASDRATYRLGYTRMDYKGVFPGTSQNRNTLTLTSNFQVAPRLSAEVAANYYNSGTVNPPPKLYVGYGFTRSDRTDLLRQEYQNTLGYPTTQKDFPNLNYYDEQLMQQMFWRGEVDRYAHNEDRLVASLSTTYRFTDQLNLRVRGGTDFNNATRDERYHSTQPSSAGPTGQYQNTKLQDRVLYGEATLNSSLQPRSWLGLDLLAGTATRRTRNSYSGVWTQGGLVMQNWFSVSNSQQTPGENVWRGEDETDGIFASATARYRNYLFLTATARNDWTSTLPPGRNSYFYPSVGLSYVFSDALKLPAFISTGQLRASYAEVGRGATRYQANNVYGFGNWEGVTTNNFSTVVPPLDLRPERKKEVEVGLNMNFLGNRLGFDLAGYRERNIDQIINLEVPYSSGATAVTVNSGLMINAGIEGRVTATPVRTGRFGWDATVNFARNRNKIVNLAAGLQQLVLRNVEDNLFVEARPGGAYGEIWGYDFQRTPDGQKVVDANGYYAKRGTLSLVGNITPDWTGGFINTFRFRNVTLTGVIDFRVGGDMISMTNYYGYSTGKWKQTLAGRDEASGGLPYYVDAKTGAYVALPGHTAKGPNGEPAYHDGVVLPGVQAVRDAGGNVTGYAPNTSVVPSWSYYNTNFGWKNQGIYPQAVYDNSYTKLRELVLEVPVPARWSRRVGSGDLRLSLIGRNLFYFHKNVPNIDPESALGTDPSLQGYEYAYQPSTRSFGFALRARF